MSERKDLLNQISSTPGYTKSTQAGLQDSDLVWDLEKITNINDKAIKTLLMNGLLNSGDPVGVNTDWDSIELNTVSKVTQFGGHDTPELSGTGLVITVGTDSSDYSQIAFGGNKMAIRSNGGNWNTISGGSNDIDQNKLNNDIQNALNKANISGIAQEASEANATAQTAKNAAPSASDIDNDINNYMSNSSNNDNIFKVVSNNSQFKQDISNYSLGSSQAAKNAEALADLPHTYTKLGDSVSASSFFSSLASSAGLSGLTSYAQNNANSMSTFYSLSASASAANVTLSNKIGKNNKSGNNNLFIVNFNEGFNSTIDGNPVFDTTLLPNDSTFIISGLSTSQLVIPLSDTTQTNNKHALNITLLSSSLSDSNAVYINGFGFTGSTSTDSADFYGAFFIFDNLGNGDNYYPLFIAQGKTFTSGENVTFNNG